MRVGHVGVMLLVIALLLMLRLLLRRCSYHMSYLNILARRRWWNVMRVPCMRWLVLLLDVDVTTTRCAWGRSACIVISIRRHLIHGLRMLRLALVNPMMIYFYSRLMHWCWHWMHLDATLLCVRISIISLVSRLWWVHWDLNLMVRRGLKDPDMLMMWLNPWSRGDVLLIIGIVVISLFNVCRLVGHRW
jgi:hypothetical protein